MDAEIAGHSHLRVHALVQSWISAAVPGQAVQPLRGLCFNMCVEDDQPPSTQG